MACELRQGRALGQGGRGQVKQPGGDDAAAPPYFSDIRQVEVKLIVLGFAQRRGFGIDLAGLLADVGMRAGCSRPSA